MHRVVLTNSVALSVRCRQPADSESYLEANDADSLHPLNEESLMLDHGSYKEDFPPSEPPSMRQKGKGRAGRVSAANAEWAALLRTEKGFCTDWLFSVSVSNSQ